MVVGTILVVFGYMMTSLCNEYYQFALAQGVCAGLGSGLLYVPALAFVSTSFTTKRPIAVGLTNTSASISGIIFPILFRELLPQIGFPWTV
jgi:MFS family permease